MVDPDLVMRISGTYSELHFMCISKASLASHVRTAALLEVVYDMGLGCIVNILSASPLAVIRYKYETYRRL
jgi:hypothetical protein